MATSLSYSVTIHVQVYDGQGLLHAAQAQARLDCDGDQRDDLLFDDDGKPNVPACLVMVFDPGISPKGTRIMETEVEVL